MSEPLWLYCVAHREATYLGNALSVGHPTVADAVSHAHAHGQAAAAQFRLAHPDCTLAAWSEWSGDCAPFEQEIARHQREYRQDWKFYTFGGNMPIKWIEESQLRAGRDRKPAMVRKRSRQ